MRQVVPESAGDLGTVEPTPRVQVPAELGFCVSNKPRCQPQRQCLDRPSCSIDPRADEGARHYPQDLPSLGSVTHPQEKGKDKRALSGVFQKGWLVGDGSCLHPAEGAMPGTRGQPHGPPGWGAEAASQRGDPRESDTCFLQRVRQVPTRRPGRDSSLVPRLLYPQHLKPSRPRHRFDK